MRKLGEGTFGGVDEVIDWVSQEYYARKRFAKKE